MKKCIVKYKDKDENFNCWCSKECKGCSNNNLRTGDKCKVSIGGFCTCGVVVREKISKNKRLINILSYAY